METCTPLVVEPARPDGALKLVGQDQTTLSPPSEEVTRPDESPKGLCAIPGVCASIRDVCESGNGFSTTEVIAASLIATIPVCPLRNIFYQHGYLFLITVSAESHVFATEFDGNDIGLRNIPVEFPGQVLGVGRLGQWLAVAMDHGIACYDMHFVLMAAISFEDVVVDVCFQGEWTAVCLENGPLVIIDSMCRVNGKRPLQEPATRVRVGSSSTVVTVAPKRVVLYDVLTLGEVASYDISYAFDCISLKQGAVVGYLSGACEFICPPRFCACSSRVSYKLGRNPARILGQTNGTAYIASDGLWAVSATEVKKFAVGNVSVACLAGKGIFTYNGRGLSYYEPERWQTN